MNTEFREAKNTIRAALREAPREKVEEIRDAARRGAVPWLGGCNIDRCGCFAQRISGLCAAYPDDLCEAYAVLGYLGFSLKSDHIRQRILVAICRAELRRRDREAVRVLIESAEPTRRDLLREAASKAAWAAPTLTVMLAASAQAKWAKGPQYGFPSLGKAVALDCKGIPNCRKQP